MKKNKGFSLLEVLITILLTTIGILGMLTLQGKSIQYTQESVNRNTAISLANSMVEILRTYRDEIYSKTPPAHIVYSEIKGNSVFYNTNGTLNFSVDDCVEPAQTPKQAAGCWLKKVNNQLPGMDDNAVKAKLILCPSIRLKSNKEAECATGYKGSSLAIQLAWKGREQVCGAENNSDICTYVMRVEI